MSTGEINDHIYNLHGQSNERFRRMIDHSLSRGNRVKLHQHSSRHPCNSGCVTYEPADEDE